MQETEVAKAGWVFIGFVWGVMICVIGAECKAGWKKWREDKLRGLR